MSDPFTHISGPDPMQELADLTHRVEEQRATIQRLAAALKLSLSAIEDALEYHGHIFDDTTHEALTHAKRESRAALREAGVEP